jgi:hypothetical protein
MHRWIGVFGLGVALSTLSAALSGPHLYHDDGGMVNWRASLAEALREAQKQQRLLFIEVCKDDANAQKLAAMFKDQRLSQLLNRFCVPVVVDSKAAKADQTVKLLLDKAGKAEPYILLLDEKGQYLSGLSGLRKTNEIEGAILDALKEHFKIPEAVEKKLEAQVMELDIHITGKDWAKAVPLFKAIVAVKGYSAKKETAYELMDTAEADTSLKYRDVLSHTAKKEFDEAKTILTELLKNKDIAPLPMASEAKDYLAAVKLMEEADKHVNDTKRATAKINAIKNLDMVVSRYGDTPFANLAAVQRREIIKAASAK